MLFYYLSYVTWQTMFFFCFNLNFILCVCVFFLHVRLYTTCMVSTCGGQKALLGLALQMVVGYHVVAGNCTQVLWKNA